MTAHTPAQGGARRGVVLGGGILGVSTAVHLVRGGAEVVLVTEADLAGGASGRSLSWNGRAALFAASGRVAGGGEVASRDGGPLKLDHQVGDRQPRHPEHRGGRRHPGGAQP
ncbi:FAD-dependent oxidoreductase [Nonomuraea sp. NPDC050643]|uniref:FAD-dependent oxidoreductase n=1 Tax=Nonomuraea sp. NPDC050643 TaxID=3155660 RepID=UPI00340996A9